jgi:toxin FitB
MFILDTNIVSELRRPERTLPALRVWAADVPAAEQYVSCITIMELDLGALAIARKDKAQGDILNRWIHNYVLPFFEGRILSVDLKVARRCAPLHVPNSRGGRDALIAATALAHGMTVVTRNVADFAPTGVPVLNPWA